MNNKKFTEKYSLVNVKKELIDEIRHWSEQKHIIFEYGTLWTEETIVSFLGYILCYLDEKTKNVFRNIYIKYYVKDILESVLNSTNRIIIKMYWFEFTKIRNQFLPIALNVKSSNFSNLLHTTTSIQMLLVKYDSNIELIENIIKKKVKADERFICKICLNSNISHGFIHQKHVCTICS